jgi:hypothetical protein
VRLEPAGIGATPTAFHAAREFWLTKRPLFAAAPPPENEAQLERLSTPQAPAEAALFRDKGEYWQITYEGTVTGIRGVKGLFYLQYLLLRPEERIHVSNLAALGEDYWSSSQVGMPGAASADLGFECRLLGDSGRVLDRRATQEYKARLIELRAELDEASQWADLERADSIRREIQFLTNQLAAAYGLTGRPRKSGDPIERVRKAVTNRIRDTIERISKQHPSLGRHLAKTIRTGSYCSYSPEHSIGWSS